MIQRSPTYIASMDDEYKYLHHLSKISKKFAYWFIRFTNIIRQQWMYRQIRKWPEKSKEKILDLIKDELPKEYVDKHLTPNYYPWEQRLCIIPDNDLFNAINENKAAIITDTIDEFYEGWCHFKIWKKNRGRYYYFCDRSSFRKFWWYGNIIDGVPVEISNSATYKSMMHSDIPNFLNTFGYINASWTLKSRFN